MTELEIINLIRLAIDLAGDGGSVPFSDEEYNAMFSYLDNLENNIQ